MWYDESKQAKLLCEYFSDFCVIILVEYFEFFMLCKCYWILFSNSLSLINVWAQKLYASIKLSKGSFVYVLHCAYFQ